MFNKVYCFGGALRRVFGSKSGSVSACFGDRRRRRGHVGSCHVLTLYSDAGPAGAILVFTVARCTTVLT